MKPKECERSGCAENATVEMIFDSPAEGVYYCSGCKKWAKKNLDGWQMVKPA